MPLIQRTVPHAYEKEYHHRDARSGPSSSPCKRQTQNQVQTSMNKLVGTGRQTTAAPLQFAQ